MFLSVVKCSETKFPWKSLHEVRPWPEHRTLLQQRTTFCQKAATLYTSQEPALRTCTEQRLDEGQWEILCVCSPAASSLWSATCGPREASVKESTAKQSADGAGAPPPSYLPATIRFIARPLNSLDPRSGTCHRLRRTNWQCCIQKTRLTWMPLLFGAGREKTKEINSIHLIFCFFDRYILAA